MADALEVRLLGTPAFRAGGRALACPSRKALWMAAYVFLAKTPQPRAKLAALLWGGSAGAKSLGSLRVALTKLPPEIVEALDVQRDTIGVAADARIDLDVAAFEEAARSAQPERLAEALGHYRGDFLEGVDAEDAPEFFDWVFAERSRLGRLAHATHVARAEALHEAGEREGAKALAEAWLTRHPADEAMHRLLMRWIAAQAGNDRALAQYDAYRRALAVTEGAAPSPAMTALAESLRQRGASAPALPPGLAPGTSFLGRDAELAALRERLADPACRLLTLHGLGGVGKTRLALALANHAASDFADGVFVAPLDGVASPSLFAQAVALACGLQPAGAAKPLELLVAFFRRRGALLVLDNLEHLLDADEAIADEIATLLAGTGPRLKVLATSREPLRLQEEWLHEVDGLPFPPAGEPADAQAFAAVQLFAQRARQVHAGYAYGRDAASVADLCALVEGLPLAIELAAGWMGTISLAELVAALREEATRLESRHRNRTQRHRSLGAMVSYSWSRLTDEPRLALAGIAVLKGTFSSEAAAHIASATPAVLAALAERSLLARAGEGRWRLHEVVRQFAWEECGRTPGRREKVIERRDAHYLGWLREAAARLEGPREPEAIREIELEGANLREAWRSAASKGDLEALAAAAPAWFDYLECRSFNEEGVAAAQAWAQAARGSKDAEALALASYPLGLFQRFSARNDEALATLEGALGGAREPSLVSRLRAARAFTLLLLGRLDEAERDAKEALAIAEPQGDPTLLASASRVLGLAVLQSGRREEGRDHERRALAFATKAARPSLLAAAHNNLALAENHLGNHAEAQAGYEAALACWRDLAATANVGRALHNLGVVATRRGDLPLALERYRAGLEELRKAGDRNLIALNLMSTGDALLRMGRPAEAREPALQALEMAERDGHLLPALDARIVLAQAAIEEGDHGDAAAHLAIVLDSAGEKRFANVLADAVVTTARLLAAAAPAMRGEALAWAREVAASSEFTAAIRKDAEAFIASAGGRDEPFTPRGLPALAAAARAALASLAPPPA